MLIVEEEMTDLSHAIWLRSLACPESRLTPIKRTFYKNAVRKASGADTEAA
jgi:hypothetical protein